MQHFLSCCWNTLVKTVTDARHSMDCRNGYVKSCIFCQIVNEETNTEILLSDEELCCFRDVNPGAEHHYLVIPKRHIDSCLSLKKKHVPMVKKMVEMGNAVLQKNNFSDLSDISLGFHIPPFYSVPHLHLHVVAPTSQIYLRCRSKYGPQAFRFLTVDKLLKTLNSQKDEPTES